MNQRHEPAAAMAGMGARSSATTKLVLVDPIPFRGGSKVATEAMLEALSERMPAMEHHVLTADHGSWPSCRHHHLRVPALLRGRESGVGYLLKQGWQTLMILWLIWRLGEVRGLLAASGPGVDLCCYWAARFAGIPVVQLIHGPVGGSRLSARALWRASQVFYLEAARPSLLALMAHLGQQDIPVHWQPFINGLREADWPTATSGGTGILWAASLLKWKGLETMLAAHQQLAEPRVPLTVCYLQPRNILQPCSKPRPDLPDTRWHENPGNLDEIRAGCGIFVSTSHHEPFGLSILEAMAAGLCVVIPSDGAWWDRHLVEGVHCFKYQPNAPDDLARVLSELSDAPEAAGEVGNASRLHAMAHYHAADAYRGIIDHMAGLLGEEENPHLGRPLYR
ncbi:glycosyltransferase family 4 protein [Aeromonas sp. SrichE-2G]|uniref:glycosyltransferase family 4 protein n=1 Tax=Aeromonas sp. SrichE-2G TaxID=2823359 RepID=UPI001FF0BF00|nr:glycosyltransferase family 4 protein [Aeromonas sp. SrichE-2G]